ncbi:hypothetical protein AAE478_001140 [Parahypoxylon ruwenzoriense]
MAPWPLLMIPEIQDPFGSTIVGNTPTSRSPVAGITTKYTRLLYARGLSCSLKPVAETLRRGEGTIELPEDDPQAVDMMVHYFYHLDYDTSSLMGKAKDTEDKFMKDIPAAAPASRPCSPALVVHAKVYALAAKYFIDGLQALSIQKFEKIALGLHFPICAPKGLVEATQEVYASTVDIDRGLRDVVIKAVHRHRRCLDLEEASKVFKELPLLTYELLMR